MGGVEGSYSIYLEAKQYKFEYPCELQLSNFYSLVQGLRGEDILQLQISLSSLQWTLIHPFENKLVDTALSSGIKISNKHACKILVSNTEAKRNEYLKIHFMMQFLKITIFSKIILIVLLSRYRTYRYLNNPAINIHVHPNHLYCVLYAVLL
jgi:hypothetical protein